MRLFLGCILAIWFILLPSTATSGDESHGSGESGGASGGASVKTDNSSEAAKTNLESEFKELRDLLRAQARQLQAQSEQLNQQQQKLQALEEQLKEASAGHEGATVASAASMATSAAAFTLAKPASPLGSGIGTSFADGPVNGESGIPSSTGYVHPPAAPEPPAQSQQPINLADLGKKLDGAVSNLGGFKFSGDFRFRLDAQLRSGNAVAGPLQNVRSRYRLRMNVDKELDPRFRFHFQLSTGSLNNGITNDQDFGSMVAKQPFSIAEAYVDFHPSRNFSLRGGRMEEVFADNMRFLWDDDVRFNGFQQIVNVPLGSNRLALTSIQFRGGEYILSNPNIVILAPNSPFVSAGLQPGQKVRDADLFHPGMVIKGNLGTLWSQQISADMQLYRNQNQIQLASLATGVPVVVNNGLGITLSGPMTGTGNATTTPGGGVYTAPSFQIARLAYRLERNGLKLGPREMPLWFDFQTARNVGTGRLRDAIMASANLGVVRNLGDVRLLYQFAIKDANSLISQFTDDDLGTGTGVNIAVHAVRFDLGLTRFLQWQNLLFVQHERRDNDPANQFFVPLARGAAPTFRYLGQLAFAF